MREIADGFYHDMPFTEYAAISAINGSSIVHMRRSPMHYRHMLDNPQAPTPAMVQGSATHRLILEPKLCGDFAVWGEADGQGRRFGKVWDAFKAAHADKMIVTADERDVMVAQAVAVHKNPIARKYLAADGPTEVSMVWTDKATGRRFKGRLDKLVPAKRVIADLKTTRDCTPYRFGGQSYALGYHIKAAMYWLGYRALTGDEPHFKFIAVESKPPYESAVYRAHPDVISQGMEDLDVLLKTLAECEASGTWPAAQQEEADLTLPTYAYTEAADDLSDLALV
jgi:hypothetical protein